MVKKNIKNHSKFNSKQKETEQETAFDINAFIQEQQLEVDEEVAPLLSSSQEPTKKKKSKMILKEEEDHASSGASEDEQELMAYMEMMKEEEPMVERVYANRKEAILSRYQDIKLDESMPWTETLVLTSANACELSKDQMNDDLTRELEFYKQALDAANRGRELILEAGIVFSRPEDYFAEMIKSDEQMAKIRQKLLDDAQALKASEIARKIRDAKKFGKKVQVEKLQERDRQRKQEMEKIKVARKKKESTQDDHDFDVSVEKSEETSSKKSTKFKRSSKDKKYGFGGSKRNKKQNTAESTDDLSSFNLKKMKGKVKVGKKSAGKKSFKSKR